MRNLVRGNVLLLLTALIAWPLAAQDQPLEWGSLPWDERIGLSWYERLAEEGDPDAQLRLGLLYERGVGGEVDLARASRWYRRAAEQGSAQAQFHLGRLLQPDNPGEAAAWFEKAAQQGLPNAAFNLALMKENGLGVDKDMRAAADLYEAAFAGGLAKAALSRGLLALKGDEPDRVTALSWLKRAELAGVTEAAAAARRVASAMTDGEVREAEARSRH